MQIKNKIFVFVTLGLVSPFFIFAQSGGTAPSSATNPTVTPVKPTSSTSAPVASPRATSTASPAASQQVGTPSQQIVAAQPQTTQAPEENKTWLYLLSGLMGIIIAGLVARLNNNSNQDDKKCDSIKSAIEQKIQDLEDEIKSWPEEKLKGIAKEKLLQQLKKNETIGEGIEIAEDLMEKYNKSMKAISLLQKKYDLCIISLPQMPKKPMNKITTHLWFDKEAKEAAEFYVATFGNGSKINSVSTIPGTPSGDTHIVSFDILGSSFMAISAGPLFKFNPSISFHVICKTKEEVDEIWSKLSPGGTVLMELGSYPFSERYGWVQDKYGLSWQIIYFADPKIMRKITPVMMLTGNVAGKTEEAINFWTSVFKDSKIFALNRYEKGEGDTEGWIKYGSFMLLGKEFGAMDSGKEHKFNFNEAISFIVHCQDQAEIDYYWEKLSAVPAAEQCGWLKDKYGVSWQIVPVEMEKMMASGDKEKMARVTQAFLKMKKFDIAELEEAWNSNRIN